ncbi:MAG: DUF1848 domain-containing protein [Mycoplasma sp.]|nr:DUF1848 domain-containing protein [Mycoplasma sp.]
MIISASYKADVPAFHGDRFMECIERGYIERVNPYNKKKIRTSLKIEDVDCIVFWTKNPEPFLKHLDRLDELGYKYYFQFTFTNLSDDYEKLGVTYREIRGAFRTLFLRIGKDRVIWRYDPIFMDGEIDVDFHTSNFLQISKDLHRYTNKCVISFLDVYGKLKGKLQKHKIRQPTDSEIRKICKSFSNIIESHRYDLELSTCAEGIDLSKYNIVKNSCVDPILIEKITGKEFSKRGNRKECGCAANVDIGEHKTCKHNCIYCYAN